MKLLLVEDNAADVRLLREFVKDWPAGVCDLHQVARLDLALQRLRQETFDVVLLDLGLPDSQGMETLTLMQQAAPRLAVVVLTGLDDEQFALQAVRAGAQDFLVKGRFDGQLLARTIGYAAQRKRAEEEIRRLNFELERRVTERTAQLQAANDDLLKQIAERRRVEEALRQSEQRFHTMADAIPQLAWMARPDGWIYWYNRRWFEYTGATAAQMEGWGWRSVHDPQALPAVLRQWQASIATGEPFDMVFPLRGADGVFRPFLTRILPLKDEQGRVLHWFGTNTDVSEQKAAEEALRAERDFNTAVLETATALIVVLDRTARITRVNRVCEEITGYTAAEICGRPVWELLPAEDLAGVHETWDALWSGKFPNRHENHWLAKDGSRRLIAWSNTALLGADGAMQYIIATGIDITERKRAEEALIRSEKLASMGRMAATIAHEINNPLAAVMNAIFLARTSGELPAQVREHLEIADDELQRVCHMTRQALGFYREPSAPSAVSINEVLDSTVDMLKSRIAARRAVLEKQYQGELQVAGIAGELRQVFSNLLSNSLDAIADRGAIKLRVSMFPSANCGGDWVRVTVSDNGAGIDPAVRPRIFEPLVTTKESVGTGLGLWVCKQIIQKHGGWIRVHSRTSGRRRGTTFTLVLPAWAAPRTEAASA